MKEAEIKKVVREGYAQIAKRESPCCAPSNSCCGNTDRAENISRRIGYQDAELESVPEGANLGLGCGNPTALASLKEGETVLDLGAGAGLDCFLAANKVGKKGKVIGIDMTPEMIDKARDNARKGGYENVEFRLGEIENIPAADNSVDVAISNCVINLSPDKTKVFKEAFRVLIMSDPPTPIKIQTHSPDPVPFLLWGAGFTANGAKRFTEAEGAKRGLFIDPGYNIMCGLTGRG